MLSPGSVEIVAQKKGETSVYSVCTLNVVTPKAMAKDFLLSTVCFISMMQKNMIGFKMNPFWNCIKIGYLIHAGAPLWVRFCVSQLKNAESIIL